MTSYTRDFDVEAAPSQSSPRNPGEIAASQAPPASARPSGSSLTKDEWLQPPTRTDAGTADDWRIYADLDAIVYTSPNGTNYTARQLNGVIASNLRPMGYDGPGIPTTLRANYFGSSQHQALASALDSFYNKITAQQAAQENFDVYAEGGLYDYSEAVKEYGAGFTMGSSGSSRYGSGAQGPVYVAPDRTQIEDMVKSYVVATTGTLHPDILDQATDAWLAAARANFDNPEQSIDPTTAMKEVVRGTDIYKHVHQVRPESVDEMQWVTGRQGQLRQLGLDATLAERVGIDMSEVGGSTTATQRGGEMAQVGATGRLLGSQRERLKAKVSAALRLV